jgi:hypothetical protein
MTVDSVVVVNARPAKEAIGRMLVVTSALSVQGNRTAPGGVQLLSIVMVAYLSVHFFRVWRKYGRLPMSERLKHSEALKARFDLRHPIVILISFVVSAIGAVFLLVAFIISQLH